MSKLPGSSAKIASVSQMTIASVSIGNEAKHQRKQIVATATPPGQAYKKKKENRSENVTSVTFMNLGGVEGCFFFF